MKIIYFNDVHCKLGLYTFIIFCFFTKFIHLTVGHRMAMTNNLLFFYFLVLFSRLIKHHTIRSNASLHCA